MQKSPAIAGQNPSTNMPFEDVLKQDGWLAIDHDNNQPQLVFFLML
jgi:hypothetical protein